MSLFTTTNSVFPHAKFIEMAHWKGRAAWTFTSGNNLSLKKIPLRNSSLQMFFKIGVLKNFSNSTGKLNWFPVKFAKFLRTPFFTKYFWWLLLKLISALIILLYCVSLFCNCALLSYRTVFLKIHLWCLTFSTTENNDLTFFTIRAFLSWYSSFANLTVFLIKTLNKSLTITSILIIYHGKERQNIFNPFRIMSHICSAVKMFVTFNNILCRKAIF